MEGAAELAKVCGRWRESCWVVEGAGVLVTELGVCGESCAAGEEVGSLRRCWGL